MAISRRVRVELLRASNAELLANRFVDAFDAFDAFDARRVPSGRPLPARARTFRAGFTAVDLLADPPPRRRTALYR